MANILNHRIFVALMNSTVSTPAQIDAQAMYMIGKISGALEHCSKPTQRIFAAKILRHTLVSALHQELHTFSDDRFDAWFAGLTTLAETTNRIGLPARALCRVILTELTLSPWPALSYVAAQMQCAFLAPSDLGDDGASRTVESILSQSRSTVLKNTPSHGACIFAALEALHTATENQRANDLHTDRDQFITSPREALALAPAPTVSHKWASEIFLGEILRSAGLLRHPMPIPYGLENLTTLDTDQLNQTEALKQSLHYIISLLSHATKASKQVDTLLLAHRSTSKAPALYELFVGFGALRSTQIENIFGTSRLGVRGMIASLQSAEILQSSTVSGAILHASSKV